MIDRKYYTRYQGTGSATVGLRKLLSTKYPLLSPRIHKKKSADLRPRADESAVRTSPTSRRELVDTACPVQWWVDPESYPIYEYLYSTTNTVSTCNTANNKLKSHILSFTVDFDLHLKQKCSWQIQIPEYNLRVFWTPQKRGSEVPWGPYRGEAQVGVWGRTR